MLLCPFYTQQNVTIRMLRYTSILRYISLYVDILWDRYDLYLSWENNYKELRTVITPINLYKSLEIELARYLVNVQ